MSIPEAQDATIPFGRRLTPRVVVAMTLLLGAFLAASVLTLYAVRSLHESLHAVKHEEEGVRAALELSGAIREEYAHQAHIVILGDRSHLPLYQQARAATEAADNRLALLVGQDPQKALLLAQIRTHNAEIDQNFRQALLPAVDRGDRLGILAAHARTLALVGEVERLTKLVAASFETSIASYESHAGVLEHRALRRTLALLALALVLTIGVAVYLLRGVARPMRALAGVARRLGSGDLSHRAEVSGAGEVLELAGALNQMASSLRDHERRLIESEKLAGVGRLAAGVAHEINNPLGVILGYARLLAQRPGAPEEELRAIEAETLRCRDIVQGLLDLSRPLKLVLGPIDLAAIAREVLARLSAAGELTTGVYVEVSGEAPPALADEGRVHQILENLLRNAAQAGGAIEVGVEARGDRVEVRVRDHGAGLSSGVEARLFEPFFTTRAEGTGLGLAVSRALARAQGGELLGENDPRGGALFVLTLPRSEG